jgi:hypothetical protein
MMKPTTPTPIEQLQLERHAHQLTRHALRSLQEQRQIEAWRVGRLPAWRRFLLRLLSPT